MELIYGKYILSGTVDEIREFMAKEAGTTILNTANSTINETLEYKEKVENIIKCPHCGSENITAYYNSANLTNNANKITIHCKCYDCNNLYDKEL